MQGGATPALFPYATTPQTACEREAAPSASEEGEGGAQAAAPSAAPPACAGAEVCCPPFRARAAGAAARRAAAANPTRRSEQARLPPVAGAVVRPREAEAVLASARGDARRPASASAARP
jgi:hypothetical protein